MPRTILVHMNLEVPDVCDATADEIGDAFLTAVERGLFLADGDLASGNAPLVDVSAWPISARRAELHNAEVCAPLVEEV